MEGMRVSDYRTVLDVVHSVGELGSLDEFRDGVVAQLPRLVEGDVVGYNEVAPPGDETLVLMDPPSPAGDVAETSAAMARLAHEHPIIVHQSSTGDGGACTISDFISKRDLHRRELYRDWMRYVGGEDQLAISFPAPGGVLIGLAVNRARGGFGVRERGRYDAGRPFFEQAYRNVLERSQLRAGLEALRRATDALDRPVLVVRPDAVVEYATDAAVRWLKEEHALGPGDALPEPLRSWFATERRRAGSSDPSDGAAIQPLILSGNGTPATARFVPGGPDGLDTVIIETPEPPLGVGSLMAAGLTRREAEVLLLASLGKRNADIASALDITGRTVAKHLNNVYAKLAVTSRTAALQRVREILAASALD